VTSADGEGLLVDGGRRKRMRVWLIVGIAIVNVGVAAVTRPVVADGGDPSDSSPEEASLPTTPPAEASISGMIDPQLVEAGDGAWAVGSSLDGITMPFYERNDDDVWEEAGDALTKTPAWSSQGFISPSVVKDGATWWLFYAAVSAESGRYCIGAAAAKNPSDGFEPVEEPLRCTDDRDLLDPAPYRSHEGLFLTWAERSIVTDATDHTSSTTTTTAGTETDLWELAIAPLAPTAGTVGEPTVLLTASGRDSSTWEAGVIDGPALVDVDDTLVLFYGGNRWGSADYGVGYATCTGVSGPCERQTVDEPLDVDSFLDVEHAVDAVGSIQPVVQVSTDGIPTVGFHGFRADPSAQQATKVATFDASVSWTPVGSGRALSLEPIELDLDAD
jgi:Glycosyl hydrolases family 43